MEWKEIIDYPDYRINEEGQVESKLSGEWRAVRPSLSKYGYWVLNLRGPDKQKKMQRLHRLVCRAFNGEAPVGKDDVNHIDGDKSNCHRKNLEWCTRGENNRHALKNELSPNQATVGVIVRKPFTGEILEFEFRKDVVRHFGLNEYKLEKLMSSYPHAVLEFQGEYYSFEPVYRESSKLRPGTVSVRVKDYRTGEIFTAESIRLASIRTGVNRFRLDRYLKRGQITSGYVFKLVEDLTPWPEYSQEEVRAS